MAGLLGCCVPGTARFATAADNELAARAVLARNGLTAVGTMWLTAEEVQLRKRIEGLDALEKRYRAALQQEKAMLVRNEAIRAQLLQAETAKAQGKQPPPLPTSPSKSAGTPAAKAVKLTSQMPDVTGTPDATPLQAAVIELVNARQALLLSVLFVRQHAGKLEADYAELRDDRSVNETLAKLGAKHRLGPAKDYQREQARLEAAARVFTDRVPVYRESGRYQIAVVLGEETPATMSYAENSQPTWITANLAQASGIVVPDDAPQESVKIESRTIQARKVRIPQLRISKFVLKDVPALVLSAEDEDLGSQLGVQAFGGYRLKFEPREMQLLIEPAAASGK